ncbi:drug/metabolite transporter (DMT)-like permease [Paenibacillus sp. 4624]|uniref:EamA family transporter n=1 Tax=Paenibacillus sp. 4624 TaxID=3156453 RepID=UPI003D200B53
MYVILLLVNVVFLTSGQVLWKMSVRNIGNFNLSSLFSVLLSPYFIMGGFLYVMATLIWIYLLTKLPLSTLYPMQSLAYVFGLLAGYFIFHEFISFQKIIGVAIILIGVYFIAK